MERNLHDLELRLSRMERYVRFTTITAAMFLVCTMLLLTIRPAATQASQKSSEHVVHAPFKVVDAAGKMIVDVEDARNAEGHYIRLFDTKEKMMVHIGMNQDGGEVSVYSPKASATMYANADSAGLSSRGNTPGTGSTAQLASTPNGGALWLYDKTGKHVVIEQPAGSAPK